MPVRCLLLVSLLVCEVTLMLLQIQDVQGLWPSVNAPAKGGDGAREVWGLWLSLGQAEGGGREEKLVLATASCLG